MPAAPVNAAVQAPVEKVYGGCGVYGHRGPYGGCRAGGQAGGWRYRR
ncbi:GCG_CRPN prefix-to-repeats domain-containing protein [Methylocystis sp. SC2]